MTNFRPNILVTSTNVNVTDLAIKGKKFPGWLTKQTQETYLKQSDVERLKIKVKWMLYQVNANYKERGL